MFIHPKNIAISDSVKTIGSYSFGWCISLKTIIIGESVETIGTAAFSVCLSLICIYFYGETSPTISTDAFNDVQDIPSMTLKSYQNETFSKFKVSKGSNIEGCLPYIDTFTESNAFTKSNSFSKVK